MGSIHSGAFYQTTSKTEYFFLPDFLPDRSYLPSRTAETLDHYFEMIHLKNLLIDHRCQLLFLTNIIDLLPVLCRSPSIISQEVCVIALLNISINTLVKFIFTCSFILKYPKADSLKYLLPLLPCYIHTQTPGSEPRNLL